MSFTVIEQCTARLNRSELAVPGSNTTFLEKAAQSPADVIFLDLEDAVAPDDKEQARKNIIEALNDLDWVAAPSPSASTAWTPIICTAMWWTSWSRPSTSWT